MNYFIEQLAGMGKEELLFILAGMGEERGLQCFVGKQLVQCLCHLCCVTDGCQQSGTPLVQNFAWSCGAVGSHDELAITVGSPSNLALWAMALAWAIHG